MSCCRSELEPTSPPSVVPQPSAATPSSVAANRVAARADAEVRAAGRACPLGPEVDGSAEATHAVHVFHELCLMILQGRVGRGSQNGLTKRTRVAQVMMGGCRRHRRMKLRRPR